MRTAVRAIQVLVGVLFVISGIVKANDPLGLAYKMEEFFQLWTSELQSGSFFAKGPLIALIEFSERYQLGLSIGMITLEILAGLALLLGWKKRFLLPLLLVLIVFFTFLTSYAVLSGKFTNCGCFGDCLPIPPGASLAKDIALLVLVLVLLVGAKHIQPVATPRVRTVALLATLAVVLFLQWYVLYHLPLADCLPFKKGNNIAEQMKPPAGSVPDSSVTLFTYKKNGKEYNWSIDQLPADFESYEFVGQKTTLIRKGNAEPPIKGFSLNGVGMLDSVMVDSAMTYSRSRSDSTQAVLALPRALMLFCLSTDNIDTWADDLRSIATVAREQGIPLYLVSSQSIDTTIRHLSAQGLTGIVPFTCDFTVVKTAARTNPTLYDWRAGTVIGKWGRGSLDRVAAHLKSHP